MALQQRARAWRHPRFLVGAAIAVTFVATFCANVWVADRVVYEGGMLLARVLHKGHPVRRNLQESLLRDHRHYHSRHPPDVRGRPQQQMMIAWLMAFPNSGTSYASRFVRETTRTLSASNYADETQLGSLEGQRWPVFANQPDGPFWIKPDDPQEELMYKEPSRYILTKVCVLRASVGAAKRFRLSMKAQRILPSIIVRANAHKDTLWHALHPLPSRKVRGIHLQLSTSLLDHQVDRSQASFHCRRERSNHSERSRLFGVPTPQGGQSRAFDP